MRTVYAAESAVSILISGEAPPYRRQLLAMVRNALEEAGLQPWDEMEADCFQAGEETLLLARPGRETRYFRFESGEALRAAASGCAGDGGSLYCAGGGYILSVPSGSAGPALYEFGTRAALSPDWELHAREQGLCILEDGAMDALRRGSRQV